MFYARDVVNKYIMPADTFEVRNVDEKKRRKTPKRSGLVLTILEMKIHQDRWRFACLFWDG